MLALGLGIARSLAGLPALLGVNALPALPAGWAFVTLNENHVIFDGHFLIVEVR